MTDHIVLTKSQAWSLYLNAMDVVQTRGTLTDWCAAIAAARLYFTWSTSPIIIRDASELMGDAQPAKSRIADKAAIEEIDKKYRDDEIARTMERFGKPFIGPDQRPNPAGRPKINYRPPETKSLVETVAEAVTSALPIPDFVKPFKHGPIPDYRPASVRDLNR